jgi:beta-N-acetylhexosaminidase
MMHDLYAPLFVSIEQAHLTQADKDMLRHPFVGGVVIFSKNFQSRTQVKALIADIKALKDPALLVCVDHEGGRVQRFRQEFTVLPPMHQLGQLYDADPVEALACAKACGYIIGTELGSVGVDFSFTPVLDLDYGQSSVIGDRSFHADPLVVTVLAGSLVDGLAQAGMQAIGKHFPGHGYVVKDSHLELPQDPRSFAQMAEKDLLPFKNLHPKLAGLMTAHVLYPNIAPQMATFSSYWLKEVLRQELGYQGLIFSDDLLMKATDEVGDISTRAKAALDAGCDILLLCNSDAAVLNLLADKTLIERIGQLDYTRLYYQARVQTDTYQDSLALLTTHRLIHHV